MDGEAESSSSKRRERLLALRSAANVSPATAPPPIPSPAPSLLPEPDLAGDHHAAAAPRARQPHRFVYYTNPAAAFSSSYSGGGGNPTYPHKRKSPPACYASRPAPHPPRSQPYAGPGNCGSNYMAPSPVHPPSQMPQVAPGSSPWRSPMEFQDPISGYQGAPPSAPPWGPHSAGCSPHASYGRGRGQNYNSSPGIWGRGGRGGVGFHNYSGQDRRSYFNKTMVDDPWQDLQPIVGNIFIPRGGSKSWHPESLREKKETPAYGQIKSTSSGLSLAEYLDLSFNEASKET
ncbi:hypothetical protein QOZ80_4BG0360480 [Eleusine coracana subsp. coracana]|nr:hypothetical protein QOZ80_4BG0360480 [Eleusine coracana subsp. coracana]